MSPWTVTKYFSQPSPEVIAIVEGCTTFASNRIITNIRYLLTFLLSSPSFFTRFPTVALPKRPETSRSKTLQDILLTSTSPRTDAHGRALTNRPSSLAPLEYHSSQWQGMALDHLDGVTPRAGKAAKPANEDTFGVMRHFPNGKCLLSLGILLSLAYAFYSRNCTKHQVRCDYMETIGTEGDGEQSPEQSAVVLTPNSESGVDLWQQTGCFPYPDLHVFPPPPIHEYTKNELRLIHHLSTVSNDLLSKGTPGLTLWTEKIPK